MARKDKNLKKLVRARMAKTGESYQAARRQVEAQLARKTMGSAAGEEHEAGSAPTPRFSFEKVFAAGGFVTAEPPDPEKEAERRRRQQEQLIERLKKALNRLVSPEAVPEVMAEIRKQRENGRSLQDIVWELESIPRHLRHQIEALQPIIRATMERYRALEPQIEAAMDHARMLQPQIDSAVEAAIDHARTMQPQIDSAVEAAIDHARRLQPELDAVTAAQRHIATSAVIGAQRYLDTSALIAQRQIDGALDALRHLR